MEPQVALGENVSPYHQPKIAREFWPQIPADYPAKIFKQLAGAGMPARWDRAMRRYLRRSRESDAIARPKGSPSRPRWHAWREAGAAHYL